MILLFNGCPYFFVQGCPEVADTTDSMEVISKGEVVDGEVDEAVAGVLVVGGEVDEATYGVLVVHG